MSLKSSDLQLDVHNIRIYHCVNKGKEASETPEVVQHIHFLLCAIRLNHSEYVCLNYLDWVFQILW